MIGQVINRAEGNQEIINWLNTTGTKAITKYHAGQVDLEHIVDYLLRDKDAPKKLIKASYQDMLRKSKEWTAKLNKRGENIVETEQDIEVIKVYKSGVRLVRLVGKAAYQREGNLMRHCSGSYYGNDKKVYSLRNSENKPCATFEVDKQLEQIKGRGNGCIHPKYIKYVLDIITTVFNMPVRDSEMRNLGYTTLAEDTWRIIDTQMQGGKELTWKGKRYLYIESGKKLTTK